MMMVVMVVMVMMMTRVLASAASGDPWFSQNPPPTFDKALITRSTPVCGADHPNGEEYNLGLHVMALFLVLTQSSLACAFPIIAKKFPRLRIPPSFLFSARHFGTGVLIATAFVHLLPTAFISLTDACLPAFWNKDYPAMAGAIAMGAVFFVTAIEMVFTRGVCRGGVADPEHSEEAALEFGSSGVDGKDGAGVVKTRQVRPGSSESEDIGGVGGVGEVGFGMAGRRRSRRHSVSQGLQILEDMGKDKKEQIRTGLRLSAGGGDIYNNRNNSTNTISRANECAIGDCEENGECSLECEKIKAAIAATAATAAVPAKPPRVPGISETLTPEQVHKKALLQVALLEMGILFHSVFIGMALSVTGDPGFLVLLVAILIHQTFEGLALGSRIAVLPWKPNAAQPWLMALAYGLTTPIGQAIGLATHTLYRPESQVGLLMVGVMNAISSGLLVFAGLVELLAEDFLSDESWVVLKGRRRLAACFFVFMGAFGMAFVGAFA